MVIENQMKALGFWDIAGFVFWTEFWSCFAVTNFFALQYLLQAICGFLALLSCRYSVNCFCFVHVCFYHIKWILRKFSELLRCCTGEAAM